MILSLAWRNIWRNKRRTFITLAAIAFAVFMSAFMRSFQAGVWDSAVDGAVKTYFGYAQIHKNGYWDDQSIENAIPYKAIVDNIPSQINEINDLVPRIESFALASEGDLTSGVLVLGISPEKENRLTNVKDKLIEGEYLSFDDNSVLVASGLAEKLGLHLHDTLVLISQGYHGVNAAGKYPISGIFEFALPDLNKRLLLMPILCAQTFYRAEGLATTIAVNMDDKKELPEAMSQLKTLILPNKEYEFMSWKELMPELIEARQLDEAGGYITLGILYLLIAFALFGTILMMTKERSYEFGVLTAIGMGRWKLFLTVWIETIILGFLGSALGILISMPIIYYLKVNPITVDMMAGDATEAFEKFGMSGDLPTAFEFDIFANQAIFIFILTSLMALYALYSIMRLDPVKSMRA
tara:strand:- start:702 stop:1931 length:1230 start_codon:yes stop_codon:yes gene_type:complete